MRLALVLSSVVATAAAAVFNRSAARIESGVAAGNPQCREPFFAYSTGCVYIENGNKHTYQQAVDLCSSLGSFAPSLHSKQDLTFWSDMMETWNVYPYHFWLDAYCPSAGEKYKWRDGTETDYYGPENELKSCDPNIGFHVEWNGVLGNEELDQLAPALCVYDPSLTTLPPTIRPTTPKSSDVPSEYCSCNPSTVYLDIVFVVDASDSMTKDLVGDVTATIKSTLYGLTFGTGHSQSNVAAIAYGETVQTVVDFGGFRSSKDISSFSLPFLGGKSDKTAEAIKQASAMLSANGRSFTKGVIVLLTNSYDQRQAVDIAEAANLFENNGGILVSIDYSEGSGLAGLQDLASAGYYINDTASNPSLDSDMLYAFCDANCFCKNGLTPYTVANERGRNAPDGCYRVAGFSAVYQAAKENCDEEGGIVSTVHDDFKNFFLMSLFPSKTKYWLGLQRTADGFMWADGSTDAYVNFAPGNPAPCADCVYAQQQTGFNTRWFSAPCTDPLKNSLSYACQLPPCASDYDCSA